MVVKTFKLEEYKELMDTVEDLILDFYDKHGAVVFPLFIHATSAIAAMSGYSEHMKETLVRSIDVVKAIEAEPEGTLQ
jgi:hypothetical protein